MRFILENLVPVLVEGRHGTVQPEVEEGMLRHRLLEIERVDAVRAVRGADEDHVRAVDLLEHLVVLAEVVIAVAVLVFLIERLHLFGLERQGFELEAETLLFVLGLLRFEADALRHFPRGGDFARFVGDEALHQGVCARDGGEGEADDDEAGDGVFENPAGIVFHMVRTSSVRTGNR